MEELSIDYFKKMRQTDGRDFVEVFRKKLSQQQSEYQKKYVPYCTACAWLDFNAQISSMKTEIERSLGYGSAAHVPDDIIGNVKEFKELPMNFDYTKYAKGWKLTGEVESRETRINAVGEKFNVITGYHINFNCVRYGHGNSMWVDTAQLESIKKSVIDNKIAVKA